MADTATKIKRKQYGLLAQYADVPTLYHACEQVRDAGYSSWDAHTPFPVHGIEKAMGLPPSRLPWIVLVMALTGASAALGMQWWVHSVAYPLVISGKPFFSWQAFVPVTFEVTILCGALGAVFGMLHLNKLPRHYHSLFRSDRFAQASDDGFFISVEVADPKFDEARTRELLEQAGATHVELVED